VITSAIQEFGLTPEFNTNVIPPKTDTSTLFVIAGMQPLKSRFAAQDGSQHASFQSCIRTNDIDQVGDGTHLTSFTMVGTFGFGSRNYKEHCALWRWLAPLGLEAAIIKNIVPCGVGLLTGLGSRSMRFGFILHRIMNESGSNSATKPNRIRIASGRPVNLIRTATVQRCLSAIWKLEIW